MKTAEMNQLAVAMIAFACIFATYAMPTKTELAQAQQLVQDLTAEDLRAMKAGTKKPVEVAAAQLALADEAETEAGKYLLLQGAFKLYARAADYDAAADVLARMRKEIVDLPPEVVVELVNTEMRRVAAEKAPKVLAIFRDAQRTMKCRKELAAAESAAQAKPDNKAVQRRLAECHVGMGDWPKALEIFAKLDDEAAKWELGKSKSYDAAKAADFWWNYKTADAEPFKTHAASIYQKGLADGSITGLRKTLAEKRIKEMEGGMTVAQGKLSSAMSYCVIDLSAGPTANRYPVNWLAKPPVGGFNTDEYKTAKFVLRRIESGKFMMGGKYEVTFTKPYYCGIFEVTQKQYELIMGNNPSKHKGDMRPVEQVSWDMIRGDSSKCNWPSSANVDPSTFIGKIQARTGLNFDLPTDAQWEYTCRAGTTSKYNNGGETEDDLKQLGRYKNNQSDGKGGHFSEHTIVGSYLPNAWGLYDMHGNVLEWCLDRKGSQPSGVKDPSGSSLGTHRVLRGGGCVYNNTDYFASSCRLFNLSSHKYFDIGFRLYMNPEAPVGASARGSGAPAASDGRTEDPPAKGVAPAPAPAAKGKEISVKLATNVMMDFVPCPAGTFEMGVSDDLQSAKFKHKVTITRPFWIGKYQVTLGQWRVFTSSDLDEREKALGGLEKAKNGVRYAVATAYCNFLMKKYKRYLPKGYVYRLPTEAEWEYALHANCSDANDPYVQVFLQPKNGEAWKKIAVENGDIKQMAQDNGFPVARLPQYDGVLPPMKVGTKIPNSWGVYDMLGNGVELLLDTVQIDNFKKRWGRNEHTDLYGLIKYKTEEVDPLRMASDKSSCPCCLVRTKSKTSLREPLFDKMVNDIYKGAQTYNTFRVVIGPDLLKERGIKLPKLGK